MLFYPTAKFQHENGNVIEIQDIVYRYGRQMVVYTNTSDNQEHEQIWEALERDLTNGKWTEIE